jgi:hypothetical protein
VRNRRCVPWHNGPVTESGAEAVPPVEAVGPAAGGSTRNARAVLTPQVREDRISQESCVWGPVPPVWSSAFTRVKTVRPVFETLRLRVMEPAAPQDRQTRLKAELPKGSLHSCSRETEPLACPAHASVRLCYAGGLKEAVQGSGVAFRLVPGLDRFARYSYSGEKRRLGSQTRYIAFGVPSWPERGRDRP